MRAIKFRGFSKKQNKWVYGYYALHHIAETEHGVCIGHKSIPCIFNDEDDRSRGYWDEVVPGTVGQFTGLQDKHGREIYEGDILREPPKNGYEKENYVAYEVFWHDNDCASHHIGWQMNRCHFQGCICGTMYIPEFLPKATARMEVIGNVFDNPDLIEKGGKE